MCVENLALQKMKMMLILSPRATGAVGLGPSWECPFVLGRDNVKLFSFPRGLTTLDPWRASQGTPRPANTSLEKDTKFCSQHMSVLSARHHQEKNPRCRATSARRRLRPFTNAAVLRCSTTGACGESAHQTRSMPSKPKPNALVGPHDHIMHWLEMRTERPHLSNRGFHGTVALNRMSWCRSGTCQLLSDSCQLFSLFAYRCFAVGLYNHERPNTDVSRKIGGLASFLDTREGCFLELQQHLCSADVRQDKPAPTRTLATAVGHTPSFATRLARQWPSRRRTPFGSTCLLDHGPEADSFDDAPVSLSPSDNIGTTVLTGSE